MGAEREHVVQERRADEQPDQTDALHSIISTPFFKDGYIYGVCSYGELRCLKADNGDRVWNTRKPTTSNDSPVRWANAFLVAYFVTSPLFGILGDRASRPRLMSIGVGLWSIATAAAEFIPV